MTILVAVLLIVVLQFIRVLFFPISPVSRIVEWILPTIGFFAIPIIWLKVKRLSTASLGLVSDGFRLKYVLMGLAAGLAGFLPVINHQLIREDPVVLSPQVFIIGVFLVLLYAPLREFFWRGFIQKKLEDSFEIKWLSILAVTLLAILAEIPLFISYGKTPQTVLMPLFDNLVQNLLFGFVFYKTKKLQTAMIGHSVYNIGFIIAHGIEIIGALTG